MRHILLFHNVRTMREFLAVRLEHEGYAVTMTTTADDALMTLRSALHPLVAILERRIIPPFPCEPFFERVRDHPDLYGQHRYIVIHRSGFPVEGEQALMTALGVLTLERPFSWGQLLNVIAQAVASLP